MCATIRSLPFTTGAKPIFLSGFNCRARAGSHRKNLIFAPCAAYHGVFYACIFGGFCAILQKNSKIVSYSFAVATYPREGTETCSFNSISFAHLVATYPREGTETSRPPCLAKNHRFGRNLSPRGDGNIPYLIPWVVATGRNLSPRGDGNITSSMPRKLKPSQLIPARGRKLHFRGVKYDNAVFVATYPREGTETALPWCEI